MRLAFIARSTLYDVPGGDTIQVQETAAHLRILGVETTIHLTHERIDYSCYDLFHFFNLSRPADILYHLQKTNKPTALSPLLIDYSEYDRQYRQGISGFALRNLPQGMNEYAKTVGRWLTGKDALRSKSYLWKGQQQSMRSVLDQVTHLLPNSELEYQCIEDQLAKRVNYTVVPNGINTGLFQYNSAQQKDVNLVLCAARIEGIKNQFNLIRALNNTAFQLLIVGSTAPNQKDYYHQCKQIAADNVRFEERISQETLSSYYQRAKVHVLPSWFETCGLSSLEAAAMGCNIVITDKGYTRDYFENDAFYCDPSDPESIRAAIELAASSASNPLFRHKIRSQYTWQQAAKTTLGAYHQMIST